MRGEGPPFEVSLLLLKELAVAERITAILRVPAGNAASVAPAATPLLQTEPPPRQRRPNRNSLQGLVIRLMFLLVGGATHHE
jgi:hypothetical protein